MSVEPNLPAYPGCIRVIDDELNSMTRRVEKLLSVSTPTQDVLTEIITTYSNVAYIFMYLEGNHRHLDYEPLMKYYEAFFNDRERDNRMLALLSGLHCADPKAEADRRRWLAWLDERIHSSQSNLEYQIASLYVQAQRILREIDEHQAALLRRLGVKTAGVSAAAVFYGIVSSTQSSVQRSKLALAWRRERDHRLPALTEIIDEIIAERRRQTKKKGFNTVLEETFLRCSVSESDTWEFIRAYLARSLRSHVQLVADICNSTGYQDNPIDHFGYYLRTLTNRARLPLFRLDTCLDYLLSVARRVFGLTIEHAGGDNLDVITVAARVGDAKVGTISFDLLDTGPGQKTTNRPMAGGRSSLERVSYPDGHVLCCFQYREDGVRHMTFESMHSLFHEFGHALTHLLIRLRLPNQSGLEYLPLERLENLSMWFEKWVYHPQCADSLALTTEEREGLTLCQRIKKLEFLSTNLESVVTAALDFDVHRRTEGGLAQSFQRLDDEFSIADHIAFGRLPHYFTAPMFRANPGAGFVYVWGATDSTEKFVPFMKSSAGDVMSNRTFDATFSSYFDFDEPSIEPNIAVVFDFYGEATRK